MATRRRALWKQKLVVYERFSPDPEEAQKLKYHYRNILYALTLVFCLLLRISQLCIYMS